MNALHTLRAGLLLALAALAPHARGAERALPAAGVNLSGAEYGAPPGVFEKTFHYPGKEEFAWAKASGFAVVRLPFLWERLQPTLAGELDRDELQRLTATVARAREQGLTTVLDPHNYAKWRGGLIGSPEVPVEAFADFWRRLGLKFGKDRDVVFGLMNEPQGVGFNAWAGAAQAAVKAIRATGACNLTLIPGANWTGAHSWNAVVDGASNAEAIAGVRDPGPHAIEFHQYLDHDSSGEHAECRKPEEVTAALSIATDWLRKRKRKGFLGEFGAGPDAQCQAGLDAMLKHMADNADVWLGWTYWAAGAWWPPTYALSIQPVAGKPAQPQMATLAKWIGKTRAPAGCK